MEISQVGVIGVGRGSMMFQYCKLCDNARLVAICDQWEEGLAQARAQLGDEGIAYYTRYEDFLTNPEMDTVVLANYATEHAPFAIAALRAGKNVISEVLPVQNMAEAVALLEAIEETRKTYCYAENCCYMAAPREMKRLLEAGKLGEFEYGEGEYMHNCEPIWDVITRGDPEHWRNRMSAFFYCTHSVGPLLHITGQRPVRVVGLECPFNARMARMGARAGSIAVEMVTLEKGAVLKSVHGVGCAKHSIWYSLYGAKGRLESAREDADADDNTRIYVNLDENEGTDDESVETYIPTGPYEEQAEQFGHGGSDYYCLHNAFDRILGKEADTVDIYEALDTWMVGFFGYLSVLEGGAPQAIPDLRDPAVREKYRNDRRCTDPTVAGDQLLPSYSKGDPAIDPAVYAGWRARWEEKQKG